MTLKVYPDTRGERERVRFEINILAFTQGLQVIFESGLQFYCNRLGDRVFYTETDIRADIESSDIFRFAHKFFLPVIIHVRVVTHHEAGSESSENTEFHFIIVQMITED